MQQTHRITRDRDAKSAIANEDTPIPKLNVGSSSLLTRFDQHPSAPPRGALFFSFEPGTRLC